MFVKLLSFILPWSLRRRALNSWFSYKIHPTARIGFAWIFPKELIMESGAKIDHFNVATRLDKITMRKNAAIGRNNWITGFPTATISKHYEHQTDIRRSELILEESATIVKFHHLDCTNYIKIGRFTTIAGYYSQFLTHSIDIGNNRQDSKPIEIGDYTLVGTNSVILGGSILPSYSVLGAKSLLNKPLVEEWKIYGGVPAKPISDIPKDSKYFQRTEAHVY